MKKYNEIENNYMEAASKRLETTKKVKIISAIVLVALVIGTVALGDKAMHSFDIERTFGVFGVFFLAFLIAVASCTHDDATKEIDSAPYKNALDVLSMYCNEIEDNGFDASLYRKTIASYREKVKDLWNNPDKYRYLSREIDYLGCRIDLLKQVMQESFNNYTGKPEDTEMVLKPFRVNLNKDCKYGPDYVWETIELACPVKKAEVQTNE